jgi:hypothetical protein
MSDYVLHQSRLAFFMMFCLVEPTQAQPTPAHNFPVVLKTASDLKSVEGPTVADLDHDGRLDIIVASGKEVYAFGSDGQLLRGWPQITLLSCTNSPAVGDLDRDGDLEVVTFDRDGFTQTSNLYAWEHNGDLLSGFPMTLGLANFAITLYDLDGDADLEIMGAFGGRFYILHHDGTVAKGWPKELAPYYPISKASVGDIDADGNPDIIIAGYLRGVQDRAKDSRGRLYAWDIKGESLSGWPATTLAGYDYVGWCNPALADVDHDGRLEIAVGTYGRKTPQRFAYAALYRHDGTMAPHWPQFTAGPDSLYSFAFGPAFANLDEDGELELIISDLFDHLVAWNSDGAILPGWPAIYSHIDSSLVFRTTDIGAALGDIDDDNKFEILVNNNQADLVNGIWRGRIYGFNHDATSLPWSPLRPEEFSGGNVVALADLERGGSINIIAVSRDTQTWLTVWEVPGVPYVEERFPWPMYGHDRWHTSQYGFKPPDEPTVAVKEREESEPLPKAFVLHQNYPNPFYGAGSSLRGSQARTEINYQLPVASHVELRVFNLLGEEVRRLVEGEQKPGIHKVFWTGRDERGEDLPAGIYFYRMETLPKNRGAEKFSAIKKLTLLK